MCCRLTDSLTAVDAVTRGTVHYDCTGYRSCKSVGLYVSVRTQVTNTGDKRRYPNGLSCKSLISPWCVQVEIGELKELKSSS
jgi:hypothetical protein